MIADKLNLNVYDSKTLDNVPFFNFNEHPMTKISVQIKRGIDLPALFLELALNEGKHLRWMVNSIKSLKKPPNLIPFYFYPVSKLLYRFK